MAGRKVIDQRGFDWITFAIYISLIAIGAISLYSVLANKKHSLLLLVAIEKKKLLLLVGKKRNLLWREKLVE